VMMAAMMTMMMMVGAHAHTYGAKLVPFLM
jgi:hypothetical protein